VLRALGAAKNSYAAAGVDRLGQLRNVIADSFNFGMLEIKGGKHIVDARGQLSAMAELAGRSGVPLNLVVGPRAQTISRQVQVLVAQTGGQIWRSNPQSGKLSLWQP
jgi:hypothetical protein